MNKMVEITREDIQESHLEQVLSQWVVDFQLKVGDDYCIRTPRFSELRSAGLRSYY